MSIPPAEALEPVVHRVESDVPFEGPKAQRFVDPQLSRIPRRLRTIHVATTAGVGSAAGITIATVPDNAVWNPVAGNGLYTATATVGTRFPFIRFRDAFNQIYFLVGDGTGITAGRLESIEMLTNITFANTFPVTSQGGLIVPLPRIMTADSTINVFSTAAIDAADTLSFDLRVEEYTLPRGLGSDEVPTGLESGFMWDLTEPRRVA